MALMYSHWPGDTNVTEYTWIYVQLIVSVPVRLSLGFIITYLCKLANVSVQIEKYRQTLTTIGEQ